MRRKLPIALLAFATAFATAVPMALAEESEPNELGQAIPVVEEGEYNSYIVVMEADPLVAEIPQDSLDGSAAQAAAAELEESHRRGDGRGRPRLRRHRQRLRQSLNGFSALITHAEAEKLAASSKVALVIPDELLQATPTPVPSSSGSPVAVAPMPPVTPAPAWW